ncbi:transcription factor Adf-1-like [Condylostylus longicornis]|uniref:transcription factor Adf-1-like n=1 Tax=Condylostylus longicornis TaxID=2530218 RepID=UPI00244DB57F|nr:transcription factor Adf-1-like [Condylostylus longicornis]XP_055384073.1 transcription factor Adf-1-like [Condylostylus longicornis]XP_055384074.1 transcription factor Adf-1-like [Condylostylus longicornis]XP_055384075.1 transcription factor Adf-1-like [Condylostylus longicornis]XP_055384076.1 transcription factor Adf-1-like [Condylostylus longicornis]XP_055384077.1 transcription factor Adf-1-like [Condylostylus longicornis]XP_055384079.1 transcription factor Adf-1-like [Condylostylus lon
MDASVKVILLVKSRPELYDVNHPDYGNKRHHTIVWKQLAGKMGVKVQHLKAKWNSLRNSYARTIRQEILNPNAPEKSWYLKSCMSFLKPHVAHKIKRSQYLEKIRNGELLDDDDSQNTDFNDIDESTNMDEEKDDEIIVNSPLHNNNEFEDEHIEIENQPIDYIESSSQALTTVHDFTINEDKTKDRSKKTKEHNLDNKNLTVQENRNLLKKKSTDKNITESVDKTPEISFNIRQDDDQELNKKVTLKPTKIKKIRSKNFDQILELLGRYCTEHMTTAYEVESDSLFFQSILSDFQKLSDKKKRKFKTRVLSELNDLLDETESENVPKNIISNCQ